MDDIYKNIEEYNPNKKCKILIVFDDMTVDMVNNKNLNLIVTVLFISGRELNTFYYTILFCCAKKYYTKFYALFYYQNSRQMRTSTNCI